MNKTLVVLLAAIALVGTAAARNPRGGARPAVGGACSSGPATSGTWVNITPPAPGIGSANYGTTNLAIDPNNHAILYATVDQQGLWKSTNCGASWALLGTPPAVYVNPGNSYTTPYLDSPIEVQVDPADSTHLVATQGVRGISLGFYVSHDSGNTWVMPVNFYTISSTTTNDVTQLAVDPSNWNHMLLTGHSPWSGYSSSGVLETMDAGMTWTAHPPVSAWSSNTHLVAFLYNPATSQGNSQTWLVGDPTSAGFWKTENSGTSWTQVSTYLPIHGGGNEVTYASNGTVYTGAAPYPIYSTNNGDSWSQVNTSGLTSFQYYNIGDDGSHLYAMPANAVMGTAINTYYSVTPESTGATSAWTAYNGGAQTFINGPFQMYWDSSNAIMYGAMWGAGIWVLKP
jgi:hypothetical protein